MQAATRKGIYSAFVQLQLQSRIRRPSLLLRQVAAAAAARGFPASSSYGVIRAGCGGGVRGLSSTPRLYSTIPSGSGDKPAHADIGVRGDVIGTGSGPGTGTGDGSGSGSGSGNLVDGRSEVVGESTPRTASSEATPTANTIIAASSLTSEATNDSPSLSSDASSTATTAEESNLEISEEKTQQQDQQTQPQRESKPRGRPIGSGSTKRRQTKAKEKEFIPEPEVPAWFLENGVIMVEDNLVKSAMLECWIAPPHKDDFTRQEIVENIASHLRDGDPALNPETVEEYSELLAEQITAGTAKGTSTTETAGSFESAIPEPIPNASSPEGEVTLIQARIGRPTKVTYPVNKLVQMDGILQDKYPGVVDRASINSALTQLGESVQAQGSGLGGDLMKYLTLEGFSSSGKPSPEPELDEKTVTEPPESAEGLIKNRYAMHVYVWREIMAYITAGLALPKVSSNDSDVATKSHCILRCPRDGGIYYLDTIVEHVASLTRADIVRIDPQDLEEMAGDYLGDTKFFSLSNITSQKIRSLGYDAQSQSQSVVVSKEDEEVEEEEEEDELADDAPSPSFFTGQIMATGAVRTMVALLPGTPASSILAPTNSQTLDSDLRNERKVYRLLEALIGSAAAKRAQKNSPGYIDPWRLDPSAPRDVAQSPETLAPLQKTIIHIRDYSELQRTPQGATIIRMMHDIVSKKRKEGIPMVIVGTTATPETSFSLTRPNMEVIQELGSDASERTVIVPPQDNVEMFEADRRARIREVNIRHLRDIIRRRSGDGKGAIELQVPKDWHLASEEDSNFPIIPGIDEDMWNFNRAHRVAVTAIGLYHKHFQSLKVGGNAAEYTPGILTMQNLVNAVEAIIQSDNYKFEWAVQEKKRLKQVEKEKEAEAAEAKTEEEEEGEGEDKSKSSQELMKKLMKNCTPHEQKLLGGVINPDKLHVGWASVRAAPDTIEALKTLTSLALVRPEAFQYGVLATDRIPGVLLYGPPGTGKTLLAKAVAKESGATVLEVSGSEIFDMYVGEGEKNVKAIFTLAQKLSPCVVFIDEADAIFGSRNISMTRTTHREIINQFLKEWADFAKSSAFIMVATNRPFDLDDAVLRRLPRRILVDLPTEIDRYEILKIHLSGEQLLPDVDLRQLAKQTPLYSGSDLKNLCVSAALACVREEHARYLTDGIDYPPKRDLAKRHFEKAMEEISASISEDMSSLNAIRKFDEKYGDRRGRRRRGAGMGFVGLGAGKTGLGLGVVDGTEGDGRVRKLVN